MKRTAPAPIDPATLSEKERKSVQWIGQERKHYHQYTAAKTKLGRIRLYKLHADQIPSPTKFDTFKAAFKAAFNLKIFAACLLVKILIELI